MIRNIQTRKQLYDFLQSQMQNAYDTLLKKQRLDFESTLIKCNLIEVDIPPKLKENSSKQDEAIKFLQQAFSLNNTLPDIKILPKEEEGFYEIEGVYNKKHVIIYLDTTTNKRFWLCFSISSSQGIDQWLEALVRQNNRFDLVWLWPTFLETIQLRGKPRGFGLDYDYRKFEKEESEITTYLKMQLWGGPETQELYNLLKTDTRFGDKVVLSKIRMKEWNPDNNNEFALQDVKYTGKFTVRGTDFGVHTATVDYVRQEYESVINKVEDKYRLKWVENESGGLLLQGYAIHFIPQGFKLPVFDFCDKILDGTAPFRLMGFKNVVNDTAIVADIVDLHTGGKLSIEVYPDILTVYLNENTCGNTIARLYTNIQHTYNVKFKVEADNGELVF